MNKKDILYEELAYIQQRLEQILVYIEEVYCELDDGKKWREEE